MAKNGKKWAGATVASVLSLSMVLSLAGCGGNPTGGNPNPNPGGGGGTQTEGPVVLDFSTASLPIGDKLTIKATTEDGSAVT